ncbi:MAG: hypothetical protein KME60_10495 [Cyanomargarita calcarea GSE-NOS-MK-12-04C]|jgi:muramoyltetrapeptide carboxypeptidase|uniref:Uncharacterized protein n=1 Tax=Cyanomargarita calcarea GSE-NOS-MK-12-04C TaxID=2839659 RepID=A0A951QMV8_9CYAN|nr:hypothetical protein [Cyanomargarita calcarea GSE-NOS-MK-12-04C]
MNRHQFLTNCTAATITSLISQAGVSEASGIIKPGKLRPGTGVGLISPASATFVREELDIVVDAVRALGLVPYLAPHLSDRYCYASPEKSSTRLPGFDY